MVLAGKRFRTVRALERRLACVLPGMADQVLFTRERLLTVRARMRRFARVLHHMIHCQRETQAQIISH